VHLANQAKQIVNFVSIYGSSTAEFKAGTASPRQIFTSPMNVSVLVAANCLNLAERAVIGLSLVYQLLLLKLFGIG